MSDIKMTIIIHVGLCTSPYKTGLTLQTSLKYICETGPCVFKKSLHSHCSLSYKWCGNTIAHIQSDVLVILNVLSVQTISLNVTVTCQCCNSECYKCLKNCACNKKALCGKKIIECYLI